jgi:hypothetical protein
MKIVVEIGAKELKNFAEKFFNFGSVASVYSI